MAEEFQRWAAEIRRLDTSVARLESAAARLQLPSPARREWRELLVRKLSPQVSGPPWLVVAVVGGTNIGKSAVFNHLVGETASAVSPFASGTKHPVCLVPKGFADPAILERLFAGFELRAWHEPGEALVASDEHRLFWRVGSNIPPRLLALDSPDVDSDAEVNWQRADQIRQTADVLVAVLTQQKYNDAAVKRFFRKAAEADQPIVVVFNQCDLEQDATAWPQWLSTFCRETGAQPALVYVCPYDRQAALSGKLPFYPVGSQGTDPVGQPTELREALAHFEFDAIKLRTLRGATRRVVDPATGAPTYLAELRQWSLEFQQAAQALSAGQMVRAYWPALPAHRLVDEIRRWWDGQRSGWSRSIHGFYRGVGEKLLAPVSRAWQAMTGAAPEAEDHFAQREREVVLRAVEELLGQLDRLAQLGNDQLRPRLQTLLGGAARVELLRRIEASHAQLAPIDDEYRSFVHAELDAWSQRNARAIGWLRSFDHVSAIARPAITVTLAVSGWAVAGSLVHDAAVNVAGQLATEAAITGGIAGSGEVLVGTTGEGIRRAAGQLFRTLQDRYAQHRAQWLATWLERELLGDLLNDLRFGAELCQGPDFRQAEQALKALDELV